MNLYLNYTLSHKNILDSGLKRHVLLSVELVGDEKSASWPSILFLREKRQGTLGRRLGGSTADLGVVGERKICCF